MGTRATPLEHVINFNMGPAIHEKSDPVQLEHNAYPIQVIKDMKGMLSLGFISNVFVMYTL